MRIVLPLIVALVWALPVEARDFRVKIHSARPFGYFVGDLIHARAEIVGPAEATLFASSLPRPGPLGISLDLKDVGVRTTADGSQRRWEIDLVYQNFYVALDVRHIEIPPLDLRFDDETVTVPAWSVGVAPLREIAPAKQDRAEDDLRPDPPVVFADETRPKRLALSFAALSLLALAAVARDRAWPPFQKRRARIFNALARELATQSNSDVRSLRRAFQSMHRAIDRANGGALLAEDVSAFLSRRSEYAALKPSFDRFFSASQIAFFSAKGDGADDYGFAELLKFAKALARQERAQ
ncbi:nonribosomal peptide synthetase MxaA [Methylocystis echinoides]|uniref:nonribosomal peptide synthetase MxaA n=1 Tax=Methylocystis echinoides TaxID=29468 RepID=UPI003447A90A